MTTDHQEVDSLSLKWGTLPCWRYTAWVCDKFRDNDQGICMECGHYEECHEHP